MKTNDKKYCGVCGTILLNSTLNTVLKNYHKNPGVDPHHKKVYCTASVGNKYSTNAIGSAVFKQDNVYCVICHLISSLQQFRYNLRTFSTNGSMMKYRVS